MARPFTRRVAAALLTCCSQVPLHAGEFSVSPLRVDLGPQARSGALAVRNDGKEALRFQLQALEWSQDASGKDRYTDTRDLIFFPRMMSVEPGAEGVIRVGTKMAALPAEKAYRLFIEEMPSGKADKPVAGEGAGARVSFLIRFGAPVFVAPVKPSDGLGIEALALSGGTVSLAVRNAGNRHQVFQGIRVSGHDAAGQEIHAVVLADRYLLPGVAKQFSTTIAADKCRRLASLTVEVKTDKLSDTRQLDVSPAMCS